MALSVSVIVVSDEHCAIWYHAEQVAAEEVDRRVPRELRPARRSFHELSVLRQGEIRERVRQVLEGEVAPRAMGPGDRALYHGRTRLTAADDERMVSQLVRQQDAIERRDLRDRLVAVVCRRHHYYDFLGIDGPPPLQACSRLFGTASIGRLDRSNLYISGILGNSDTPFLVAQWYITVCDPGAPADWDAVLRQTRLTMIMGDHPVIIEHGHDLWMGPRPAGDFILPVRQNFNVAVELFGTAKEILSRMTAHPADCEMPAARGLFVHVDGYGLSYVY